MNNKRIKKFGLDGTIADDSDIPRMRQTYHKTLLVDMRDSGYVPVLDLDPIFYISYDKEKDYYNFSIYIHGVFVGKKQATLYDGYVGQRLVPKSDT